MGRLCIIQGASALYSVFRPPPPFGSGSLGALAFNFTAGIVTLTAEGRGEFGIEEGKAPALAITTYCPQPSVAEGRQQGAATSSPPVQPHKALKLSSRDRFARDLHDGVGESLNTLLIQIRVALARGEASRADLHVLEQAAQSALQSVRVLAYGARRHPTADALEEARRYAESVLMASGVSLMWIDERAGARLTERLAKHLAWSVRESVTNVARHANARSVEVRLIELEQRVRISIRDDGDGFSPEAVRPTPEGRGLGLLGNRERMAEIGGVSIRSAPGEGTLVLVEAPMLRRRPSAALSRSAAPLRIGLRLDEPLLALTAV